MIDKIFNLTSGSIVSGTLASPVVFSGNIASGAVSSGMMASGFIAALEQNASINSGQISSGDLASGVVQGYFGSTRHIASGTLGIFDFGSGAINSGSIGKNSVNSLNVSSGTQVTATNYVIPIQLNTQETISGIRSVAVSQSGFLLIAMASVTGRTPAVGIVIDSVLSGQPANVYTAGSFQTSSGLLDYSGALGNLVFVGRSGQIVTVSGSWNSGGFLSSDVIVPVGVVFNSGGFFMT